MVPAPDAIRLSVPKAYISLLPGIEPSPEMVLSIFQYTHTRLAPFKRIRQIEIVPELPRTISGKIKRGQLRRLELANDRSGPLRGIVYAEDDFAELQVRRSPIVSGSIASRPITEMRSGLPPARSSLRLRPCTGRR